jgi:hypothetical protein
MSTTITLFSNVVVGTPNGNYDGSTTYFESDAAKAAGYYQGQGSLQTVFVTVTDFVGQITLQATLDFDPTTAKWFDMYDYANDSTEFRFPINLAGNFAWIKAVVTGFEDASVINSVTLTY